MLFFIAIGSLLVLIYPTVDDTSHNPTDVMVIGRIAAARVIQRIAAY